MTTASDVMINQRYRLEAIIGQGGMGVVYRTVDRLTGTHVALKRVMLQQQKKNSYLGLSSSDSMRLTISQEFRVLASLRHPHIISVLDYGFDAQREPFFTMELLEDPLTIFQASQNLSFARKTGLFIQMLQALAYLHRRSVIHRDLKPDNVLVVSNKVKLLDFGLAVEGRLEDKTSETLSGTLLYMAPEVLKGDRASTASDIYAAGLIAYEMFVGRHPFIPTDSKFAFTTVDTMISGRIDPKNLPDVTELRAAVMQMVEHDPADRMSDLNTIIDSLRAFVEDKDPIEAISIRESFLQSASFVDRDREREQLTTALLQIGEKHGSVWLIGGESGVGKSRLIDELQTKALVDGILVLRGQAVAEGSAPYQVWRPILRRLVLQTNLDPLEAGILNALIPDIERLLESPIVLPPELDGPIAQQRLLNLIETVFRSQNQLMLVLLEDLQWAGEGLTILKHFLNIVSEMPLLIIGTYRDTEYPTLPAELPGAHLMSLQRFDLSTINQLTRAILGDASNTPGISGLLQQETEGNALFMIEVMRALADEAGGLARIGVTTLPHRVLSGGIQAILLQRLERVPVAAQPILQIAAAAGRELDLQLLQRLFPMVDLDVWLLRVATVIEVQDNRYRFAHDKLREAILSRITLETQSELHEQIARGLITLYGADPTQYMALAYQWEKANEHQAPVAERLQQTILYLEKAAALLFSQNAFIQSKAVYERLFNWYEQYLKLEPAGVASEREAGWYGILATIETILSNQESAIANASKALSLYGVRIPESSIGFIRVLLGETVKQILHRIQSKRILNTAVGVQRERLLAIAPILGTYSAANFALARQLPGLYATMRSVNAHEYAGLTERLASDYALMVNLTGALGLNGIAERYYQQVQTLSATHPNESPYALFLTGVYYASTVNRARAEADLSEAAANYERTKNAVGWCLSQITLASIYDSKGEFTRSYELFGRVHQMALTNQIPSIELITLYSLARVETLRGELGTAMQRLDRAITLITVGIEPSIEISAWAYRAKALWRMNAAAEAVQTVNHAVTRSEILKVNPNFASIAFINLIEILLEALEMPAILPVGTDLPALSETLAGLLKRLKRVTSNTSGTLRLRARQAWLHEKSARAERLAQKALVAATTLNAAYEIALIHYELGRHLPTADPNRRIHLETARTAFTEFGFVYDRGLALDALGETV